MIVFSRIAGTLTHDGSSEPFARGIWSGHGTAHNNPATDSVKGVGPLPAGLYEIGPMIDGGHLGPDVMALKQIGGNSFGRGGFYMHGDHPADFDWSASDGCVIAPHNTRVLVNAMADRRLRVV